jgi:hypothetical protein
MPTLRSLTSLGYFGGRDRDRTCDPYHVNFVLHSERAESKGEFRNRPRRFRHQVPFPFMAAGLSELGVTTYASGVATGGL